MIDPRTVQRILDTADIVDVVSDFVTLRRSGANWIGLCPFHNDRKPSFHVSRAKGICKCFACGEGGSAVGFIMKHENLSYPEALRYLAKKYHIEIEERELTDEERNEQSHRESLLMLTEWACRWFETQLRDTDDGRDIGMTYLRERGFGDAAIAKFRLGYSPDRRTALVDEAIAKGFSRQLLIDTGLAAQAQPDGPLYDRFRGRIIFPITNVAGKVIAFGARTLRSTDRAKYLNSPESVIYHKSDSTMYGLFQAKRAIQQQQKCFIVEGYADVITMHQAGIENVIASSGTALTEGHIRLIQRFTNNVTELFDGDNAGIHAAMRGIDLLLQHNIDLKVLLLPDGHDPDSFARSNSSSQVQQYITDNEVDFITFKARILLNDTGNDPIRRASAITDVVRSIARIPDEIKRNIYAKQCSTMFAIDERTLLRQIAQFVQQYRDEAFAQRERERSRERAAADQPPANRPEPDHTSDDSTATAPAQPATAIKPQPPASVLHKLERDLIRYVAKYGMAYFCDIDNGNGTSPATVLEYIDIELTADGMAFTHPAYSRIHTVARSLLSQFYADLAQTETTLVNDMRQRYAEALKQLDVNGLSAEEITKREKEILARYNAALAKRIALFRENYMERQLCSHPDDIVRETAFELVMEKRQLSKIYTASGASVVPESERLYSLVPKAIDNWKSGVLDERISHLRHLLARPEPQTDVATVMHDLQDLLDKRRQLAKLLGNRVVGNR